MLGRTHGSNRRRGWIRSRRARWALSAAIGGSLLVGAASASAGTVTYRNDATQFNPVGFFDTQQSTITVPPGRTPVARVELPGVRMSAANPDGDDLELDLIGPAGTSPSFDLIGPLSCNFYSQNTPTNFTDSGLPIGGNQCSGDRRPLDPRTLALFNGGPSSGTWTMLIDDNDNDPGSDVAFFGWGLTIVHALPTLEITTTKQRLGATLSFTATSNANGTLVSGGGVKPLTTQLLANQPTPIAAPLNETLRKRLAKRLRKGKRPSVSVEASFTDETGGVVADQALASFNKVKRKKRK